MAWVEGEGERQRRPVLPPAQAKDPALRGWAQVAVCALAGTLASALFVCWLATAWDRGMRVTVTEKLRVEGVRRLTGDPASPPAWLKGGGAAANGNGDALGVLLCFRAFAAVLGTVIGAVLLLAACAFYNKLAGGTGSPRSVPEPRLGKALGITFVTALVHAAAGFELLSLPLSLLVMARYLPPKAEVCLIFQDFQCIPRTGLGSGCGPRTSRTSGPVARPSCGTGGYG